MSEQPPRKFAKRIHWELTILIAALLVQAPACPQQSCTVGVRIDGVVTDPAGAAVAAAQVRTAEGEETTSDDAGRFVLPCVPTLPIIITVQAAGFATKSVTIAMQQSGAAHTNIRLNIEQAQSSIQVNANDSAIGSDEGAETSNLNTADVQRMADDPDDFLRELEVLASAAGGDPSSAAITVDGFQNASALPPKSSIASIRINPDLFSAEYPWPPFGGGVIQIITKPGADSYHGALFFTDSDGIFNARDPFSLTSTPATKQRYGFELSGPILPGKSGFALALEKRDINEFNVVNAVTLDANGDPVPLQQTVSAPQRLWIASARGDWQASANDIATLSYSANVNTLGNQGVGGLVLPEAGYSSLVSDYDLRFSNTFTVNANLLHESRIGYSWKRTRQTPSSIAPSVQVAGYFAGGGATSQGLSDGEGDLEIDQDAMLTRGKHNLKLGIQSLGLFVRDYDPDTFNGAYIFGGGSAPVLDADDNPSGATTTITGIEQYRRALLNLPGGAPTSYQLTTGTPLVPFTQWRVGFFAQDSFKLLPRLTLDAGLRYQVRKTPNSFGGIEPRLGLAWSPDARERWVIHARFGLFHSPSVSDSLPTEAYRLNGTRQHEIVIYSPNYVNPLELSPQSVEVSTIKELAPSLAQQSTLTGYLNVERVFPHQWHARVNYYIGDDWNSVRIRNFNAPMVASSVGIAPDPTAALLAPRPFAPNENIFRYENSGHLAGNIVSFNLEQQSYKRFHMSFRYGHLIFKSDDVDSNGGLNSPQSSYGNQGESARVDWMRENSFSFMGNATLPYKVEVATQFYAGAGRPYNITTGTDNNGDGDFNDRPSYASTPGPGVYSTRFGLLTANTVNGNVPRNLGSMPGPIHLDTNISREFKLGSKDADHPRSFTCNARSANLLNHTNVTAVNTILSSTSVGQPVAAETARRVELGIRFAF